MPARKREEEAKSVVKCQRIREAVLAGLEDRRWGTQLGRLFMQGRLLPNQFEAGERLLGIITRHRSLGEVVGEIVVDLPTGRPKISSMERVSGGERPLADEDAIRTSQEQYDLVFAGVMDMSRSEGVMCWKAAVRLCVDDEHLLDSELIQAKRALDRISILLNLPGTEHLRKRA